MLYVLLITHTPSLNTYSLHYSIKTEDGRTEKKHLPSILLNGSNICMVWETPVTFVAFLHNLVFRLLSTNDCMLTLSSHSLVVNWQFTLHLQLFVSTIVACTWIRVCIPIDISSFWLDLLSRLDFAVYWPLDPSHFKHKQWQRARNFGEVKTHELIRINVHDKLVVLVILLLQRQTVSPVPPVIVRAKKSKIPSKKQTNTPNRTKCQQ